MIPRIIRSAAIVLIMLSLPILFLYHFIFPLNSLSSGYKPDDPALMVWNLYIVYDSVTQWRNPLWTDMIFYPVGVNLTHHALVSGFFPLTFIVGKLSGGDILFPLYAYHLCIWLSFSLLLLFSFLTLKELGYQGYAALIPSIAYGFSNFYMEHVVHLNLISGFFLPATAFFLIRFYKNPTFIRGVVVSSCLAISIYFTEYSLFIYGSIFLLLCRINLTRNTRQVFWEKIRYIGFLRLTGMFAIFMLAVAPFIIRWLSCTVVKPFSPEYTTYSANIIDFFIPRHESTPFYGRLFSSLNTIISPQLTGHEVFIGFPLLVLSLFSLRFLRKPIISTSAFLALMFFILSLGPFLKIMNSTTGMPLPFWFLMQVPLFDEFRTPSRFIVFGTFFLMILAAEGGMLAQEKAVRLWGKRIAVILLTFFLVWTAAERYRHVGEQPVFHVPDKLQHVTEGPVINLPITFKDGQAALLQTIHRQPIATGYIARLTDENMRHYEQLKRLFKILPDDLCDTIGSMGYRQVVISDGTASAAVQAVSKCGVNVVDLRKIIKNENHFL